jgi:hypothetical protein
VTVGGFLYASVDYLDSWRGARANAVPRSSNTKVLAPTRFCSGASGFSVPVWITGNMNVPPDYKTPARDRMTPFVAVRPGIVTMYSPRSLVKRWNNLRNPPLLYGVIPERYSYTVFVVAPS